MSRKPSKKPQAQVQAQVQEPVNEAVVAEAAFVNEPLPVVNTCLNCRHYLARQTTGDQKYGFCRRYPPVTIAGRSDKDLTCDGPLGIFPITLSTSVCGEHLAE